MKKNLPLIFVLPVFIFSILGAKATNENLGLGARSAGIGNASVCLSDIWAVHHNQAALTDFKTMGASIYYENRFLVKEMGLKAATFVLPLKKYGVFGATFNQFGFSLYKESKYGVSFARTFGNNLSVGMQLNYLSTSIGEGYGSRGTFTVELGMRTKIQDKLFLGAHIYNPTRAKAASYSKEKVPTIIRLGAQYAFSEKVMMAVETEKDIMQKASIKTGLEYQIVKQVSLRTGIMTAPFSNTFGFGLNMGQVRVDMAAALHPVLGVSSQFSLGYLFK